MATSIRDYAKQTGLDIGYDTNTKNVTLGSVSLPIERFTELKSEWDKIYPNSKPVVVVTPIRVITEEEKYKDMVDQLMASYLASFPPIV